MIRFIKLTILLYVIFLENSCFIGAATHGKIAEYQFVYKNKEIVSIVDAFLRENPEYNDNFDEVFHMINIKIPETKDIFVFEIGGNSKIVLISAGKVNELVRWESDLSYYEKKYFIASFEINFINKIRFIKPNKIKYVKDAFILSDNLRNNEPEPWPSYEIKHDTLLSFPLPNEFDTIDVSYFKDLVTSYYKYSNEHNDIFQFYNLFRINKDYCGYIKDSIYVTAFYRKIGQNKKFKTLFEQEIWKQYILKENINLRLKDYKIYRKEQSDKGYLKSSVYYDSNEEVWMINNKKLLKIKSPKFDTSRTSVSQNPTLREPQCPKILNRKS